MLAEAFEILSGKWISPSGWAGYDWRVGERN
jgi:hypothetical protein